MNNKMTILVDMDSIIADFYFAVLGMYSKEAGVPVDPNISPDWDATFPNGKTSNDYFSQPGFFRNLAPIPESQRVVRSWYDDGHEVVIASAATLTNAPGEKFEWLSEHYPWLSRNKVFFGKEKYRLRGDVLIDDHQGNAALYRQHNPEALVIGIEYPYNRESGQSFSFLAKDFQNFESAWRSIDTIVRLRAQHLAYYG